MVKRSIFGNIQKSWVRGKSILLLGPRQTGKTTLAKQFDFDLTITFLSNRLRQEYEKNPDLILKEVMGLKLKRPAKVFIDEVQKVPEILDPIQLLIDEKKAQFFITGSSARKLKQQSEINLLPGRVISYRMDPFSQAEYPSDDLNRAIYYGALPEIAFTEENQSCDELLKTYVEVYLEEEIRKEAGLKKLPEFYRFLEFAAERSGHVVNFSKISQAIGLSHVTVAAYYRILEQTMIADRIEPIFESKTRAKLIRSPRYLFFDLGVRRLAAQQGSPLPKSEQGYLLEQYIGLELLKAIRLKGSRFSLHFWQDPQIAEIDWVLRSKNKFIPIEVKLTNTIEPRSLKHLKQFLEEYPCPNGGFVIYGGTRILQLEKNITAIPWNRLQSILDLI